MLSTASTVTRWLLSAFVSTIASFVVPADSLHTTVGLLTAVAALLLVATLAINSARTDLGVASTVATGPADDERCLHGSFRRQTSPDTAGRPQPRAPGIRSRLA